MQEAEINGKPYILPACHEGDINWLASILYDVETRRHAAEGSVCEPQRTAMLQNYERIYLNELERNFSSINAESLARRAANIDLRERIENYNRLRKGDSEKQY